MAPDQSHDEKRKRRIKTREVYKWKSRLNVHGGQQVHGEHYWETLFYMQEHVKKAFDAEGISIPFPQMDVHVDNQ